MKLTIKGSPQDVWTFLQDIYEKTHCTGSVENSRQIISSASAPLPSGNYTKNPVSTISSTNFGNHRHTATSLSLECSGRSTHAFKTGWVPNTSDYLAENCREGSNISSTVKEPANNNS